GLDRPRAKNPKAIKSLLKRAVLEQNRQLLMEAKSESGYEDMGATLVAVIIKAGRAYIANLGDSRVYRLRKGRLVQLTKDHSVVSELLRKGRIEPEQAEGHEASGQITHYIGMEEKPVPYMHSFTLKGKDRLLLCTDGLTDMVDDEAITDILKKQTDPQSAGVQLVNTANEAGGFDNITAVIVDWLGS
ncbi:PP2C family protein-serine/threonine phosphatase, partial [Planctomycetota bacterium]